jgi:hypothetical protein
VLAGIGVLALIGLFTWVLAAYIASGSTDNSERLAPSEFTVTRDVADLAASIEEHGPLFFPELGTAIGTRSIVVDHEGDDATDGWRVYWAYPADRDPSCPVQQVPDTASFTDCDGRTIDVTDLSPPDAGVFPRVDDRTTLVVDLRGAVATTTTP